MITFGHIFQRKWRILLSFRTQKYLVQLTKNQEERPVFAGPDNFKLLLILSFELVQLEIQPLLHIDRTLTADPKFKAVTPFFCFFEAFLYTLIL